MSSEPKRAAKRFAPLDPNVENSAGAPPLKGIVFDVDGTLCKPQSYMFKQMRSALGISPKVDILAHISSLPTDEQPAAHAAIRAIESEAMLRQEAQPGLVELMEYLQRRGVRMGICTRNFDLPVTHLLKNFLPTYTFSPIITRSFHPPKPDPAGILHIAAQWGLEDGGEGLIMVGDSLDDMAAGFRASAATVLLVPTLTPPPTPITSSQNTSSTPTPTPTSSSTMAHEGLETHEYTGLCIERLDELIGVMEGGFVERERGGE